MCARACVLPSALELCGIRQRDLLSNTVNCGVCESVHSRLRGTQIYSALPRPWQRRTSSSSIMTQQLHFASLTDAFAYQMPSKPNLCLLRYALTLRTGVSPSPTCPENISTLEASLGSFDLRHDVSFHTKMCFVNKYGRLGTGGCDG